MPVLLYFRGYTKSDKTDFYSIFHGLLMFICVTFLVSIAYQQAGRTIFHVYKVNYEWVFWLINLCFGLGYGSILYLLRKSPSYVHCLIVMFFYIPLELWIHQEFISKGLTAPYDYLPESSFFSLPYMLRSVVLALLDGLQGPIIVFIARIIANIQYAKKELKEASQEEYEALFPKEWTKDDVQKPNRGFAYYTMRIIGLFYAAYVLLLLLSLFGRTAFPEEIRSLLDMTFVNPAFASNTMVKLFMMMAFLFIAAYNKYTRFYATLIVTIAHAISAIMSIILYNQEDANFKDMLLASAIIDGIFVLCFCVILKTSYKDSISYRPVKEFPFFYSIPNQLMTMLFGLLAVFYSIMIMALISWRFFNLLPPFFNELSLIFDGPDPQLSNSLTMYSAFLTMAILMFKVEKLRDYLIPSFLLAQSISFLTSLYVLFQGSELFYSESVNAYFTLSIIASIVIYITISALRKMMYNAEFGVTTVSPSTARNIYAVAQACFGLDDNSAKALMKKIDEHIAGIRGRKRGLLNAPFWALEHLIVLLYGFRPNFAMMDEYEGRYYLKQYLIRQKWERKSSMFPLLAELAHKLGFAVFVLSSMSNYSTAKQMSEIGYVPAEARDRAQGDFVTDQAPFKQLYPLAKGPSDPHYFKQSIATPSPLISPRTFAILGNQPIPDEVDYLIIGSGAGAATAAYEACKHVKDPSRILMVERGSRYNPNQDHNSHEMEMLRKLYKESGLQQTKKMDLIVLQGETVGGTTVINNAVCFKMPDHVKERWKNEYGIDTSLLEADYNEVANEIGIVKLEHKAINSKVESIFLNSTNAYNNDPDILDDDKFDDQHERVVHMNSVNTMGIEEDHIGNKYLRKRSMLETYIPWSEAHGVQVISNYSAVRLIMNGNKTESVLLRSENGEMKRVKVTKAVFVGAGVIASTHFLMRSGFNHAGKHLSCNFAFPFIYETNQNLDAFDGTQITLGVNDKKHRAMIETIFIPPGTYSIGVPFYFDTHRQTMKKYRQLFNFGTLVGAESNGIVSPKHDLINGRSFDWHLGTTDIEKIKFAFKALAYMGYHSGASHAQLPFEPGIRLEINSKNSIQRFLKALDKYPIKMNDLQFKTAHPQGGNPISADGVSYRVCDEFGKVIGTDNVFVVDASIFPCSITVNTQWTVMAMSKFISRRVTKALN